jgi:hypothetical protein
MIINDMIVVNTTTLGRCNTLKSVLLTCSKMRAGVRDWKRKVGIYTIGTLNSYYTNNRVLDNCQKGDDVCSPTKILQNFNFSLYFLLFDRLYNKNYE